MAKPRGTKNPFKKTDGLRALNIAREGGIKPAMIEIVGRDGTTFRVYGENAGAGSPRAWDEAITKL
jgi:hypothetical protein